MKKNIFAIVSAVLLLAAASCTKEKEGVFNPSSKISAIYQDYVVYHGNELELSVPKYQAEQWVWIENRLECINYFMEPYSTEDTMYGPLLLCTQNFTYDNKDRLTRADVVFSDFGYLDAKDSAYNATYEYDGKYLKRINVYENGILCLEYEFVHDGSTISAITVGINGDIYDKGADKRYARFLSRINPLRFAIAPELAEKAFSATQDCAKKIAKNGAKSVYSITFNTEWDGDNLTRLSGKMMGLIDFDFTFTYDTYKNPYYGLFDAVGSTSNATMVPYMAMGKNNITEMTMMENEMGEIYSEAASYTYTYKKSGYPETMTCEETEYDIDDDLYRQVTTTYYCY